MEKYNLTNLGRVTTVRMAMDWKTLQLIALKN